MVRKVATAVVEAEGVAVMMRREGSAVAACRGISRVVSMGLIT